MLIIRTHFFTFFFIFLVAVTCYSQNVQLEIDTSYGFSRMDRGNCICKTSSGEYLTGGASQTTEGDYDGFVIKLNQKGDCLWSKRFGSTDTEYFNSIHELKSNNIMLLGYNRSLGQYHRADAWVLILNSDGDSIDSKLYGGDSNDEIISSIQLSDGNLLAVGSFSGYDEYQSKMWLLKITMNGDTVWTKVYGSPICKAVDIIELSDDTYLILGYKNIRSGYIGSKWVLKINSSGDTIWTRTFSKSFIDVSRFSAARLDNGLVALSGDSCNENQDKTDSWYALIDQDGNLHKECFLKTCPGFDYFNSPINIPGYGYLTAGSTECGSPKEDNALLVAYNVNGDTIWSSIFGSTGIDEIADMIYCNDSIIVFTGLKNKDVWFGSFILPTVSNNKPVSKYSANKQVVYDANHQYSLLGRKYQMSTATKSSIKILKSGIQPILK